MPDIRFRVAQVLDHRRYRSERGAVLFPLAGPRWHLINFAELVQELIARWRVRIMRLIDAGWKRVDTPFKRQVMRNCPPGFGVSVPNTFRCRALMVCPFCFGRDYVRPIYDGLARALKVRRGGEKLYLVEQHYRRPMYPHDENWQLSKLAAFCAPGELIRTMMNRNRNIEIRHQGAVAAAALWRIDPGPRSAQGLPALVYGALMLTPRPLEPYHATDAGVFHVHEKPSQRTLVAACARTFQYPAGMMYGDAGQAATILNAMTGVRMLSTYGDLRRPEIEARTPMQRRN